MHVNKLAATLIKFKFVDPLIYMLLILTIQTLTTYHFLYYLCMYIHLIEFIVN